MDPFHLLEGSILKEEFYEQAVRILTYVSSWNDPQIGPNMLRAFSRKIPVEEALADYYESIRTQLTNEGIVFPILVQDQLTPKK